MDTVINSDGQVTTIRPSVTKPVGTHGDETRTKSPSESTSNTFTNGDGDVPTMLPSSKAPLDTETETTVPGKSTEDNADASKTPPTPTSALSAAVPTTNSDDQATIVLPSISSETEIGIQTSSGDVSGALSSVITGTDGQLVTILPSNSFDSTDTPSWSLTAAITTNSDGVVSTILPSTASDTSQTTVPIPSPATSIFGSTLANTDGRPSSTFIPGASGTSKVSESPSSATLISSTETAIPSVLSSTGQITGALTDGTSNIPGTAATNSDAQASTSTLSTASKLLSSETVISNSDGIVSTVSQSNTSGLAEQTSQVPPSDTGGSNTGSQSATLLPSEGTRSSVSEDHTVSTGVETTVPHGQSTTALLPSSPSASSTQGTTSTTAVVSSTTDTEKPSTNSVNDETVIPSTGVASTLSDGRVTTITPPVSSGPDTTVLPTSTTSEGGIIIPITTPVSEPKPGETSSIIPCNTWFFNFCLNWGDFNIFGWGVILPPGPHPPGPPPAISFPPLIGITVEVKGPLPTWPSYTIGPDRMPTFPPKPSGPDGECETDSAEICLTRTSFGISVTATETITTATQVLSTCGTVYGCKVNDASATETTASTQSATETPVTYVVYPKEGRNSSMVAEVEAVLTGLVEEPAELYASNTNNLGLNFWTLPLTPDQADKLRKHASVSVNFMSGNYKTNSTPLRLARLCCSVVVMLIHASTLPPHLCGKKMLNRT